MMKLKHLFFNEELAKMILGNWEYDAGSLELFKYCRISANAVYPFKSNNEMRFLRFAPVSEKSFDSTLAELDFIGYLHAAGCPCNVPALSKNGERLERVSTPWGDYIAAVLKSVPGVQIDRAGFTDEIMFGYGRSLGRLHRLSCRYKPEAQRRWSWKDALEWVLDILSGFPEEEKAREEAGMLKTFLSGLPAGDTDYGLVHYDFETDNVFYDAASGEYHPIDFDDAMYHWYVMDIEQAVDSIRDEAGQEDCDQIVGRFIDGYRTEFGVSDEMLALMPVMRRFADLYGFARILRSTEEKWNNEPGWMTDMRRHLEQLKKARAAKFGADMLPG